MTDEPAHVDEAVELATARTKEAEDEFLARQRRKSVEQAVKVERRAEDLATLAGEAGDTSLEDDVKP